MFQIWIETGRRSAPPSWGMMPFPKEARDGSFQTLASGDADDGALTINADAKILGATLAAGTSLAYRPDPARHLYLVPSAEVLVNGVAAGTARRGRHHGRGRSADRGEVRRGIGAGRRGLGAARLASLRRARHDAR